MIFGEQALSAKHKKESANARIAEKAEVQEAPPPAGMIGAEPLSVSKNP